MGPFLGIIIATIASTLALTGATAPVPEEIDRTMPLVLAVAMVAAAWVTSRLARSRGYGPMQQPPWARALDVGLFIILLFETDWVSVAREASLDLPLLRQLLVLAPYFFAALVRVDASWSAQARGHAWTRARAVAFHARLLLIPIAPILLINAGLDGLRSDADRALLLAAYPAIDTGLVLVFFVLAVLVMPFVLSALLGSRELPPGSLRSALEADVARAGTRVGGIQEVDTGGLIANAAYLGLATRAGRIFISDALLRMMPEDEVRAVFAHELAHGTRRHLVWLLGFLVCGVLVLYVVGDLLGSLWSMGFAIVALLIAGLSGFIAISRRFEVEADLVGAGIVGDPDVFSRALARVAAIAGKPIDRHGMRHYAIGKRIAIVQSCAADPAASDLWARRIRAPKIAIACILALAGAGVAWKLPGDLDLGHARLAYTAWTAQELAPPAGQSPPADSASRESRLEALRAAVEETRDLLDHPLLRAEAASVGVAASMALADEALRIGDFAEARRIIADVEAGWPRGDPVGDFNREMLGTELAAIDPAVDLEAVRPKVAATQSAFDDLMKMRQPNESSVIVGRELDFLAAATGVDGAQLAYDPEAFPASRRLAVALGADVGAAETRRISEGLESEHAWRLTVLRRALAARGLEDVAPEAGTRRGL